MDSKTTVLETNEKTGWSIVLTERPQQSFYAPGFESKSGEIHTMGVCERCEGTGQEPDGKGRGHNGTDECRRCGNRSPLFSDRFGYDVSIYAAEITRPMRSFPSYHVKPALVNMGSIGATDAEDARFRANLLMVAADVASHYTDSAQMWLNAHRGELEEVK